MITISRKNAKLGGMIPSISLLPSKSCRVDAPCKKSCYAQRGNFLFPNVLKSLEENYNEYINNPSNYFKTILRNINSEFYTNKYFRWHVAGDIVDKQYLEGMVWVAKKSPKTKFLCFTKKFEIVNDYLYENNLPKNLRIVFSAWDFDFQIDNPHALPVAYINFKHQWLNPNIPITSIPCIGSCEECLGCWQLKQGQSVVFDEH